MKRILSTAAFIILIVAIAAVAVYALNGQPATETAAAPAAVPGSASVETNALAPAATLGWNAFGLPLDVSGSVTTADQVAAHIESFCDPACPGAVEKVSKWDPVTQTWGTRTVGAPFPPDYSVYPGQALLVAATSALNASSFAWVGDVPEQCPNAGCIQYGVGNLPALNPNGWNFIMIPLDKSGPTMADALAADIGNVTKVSKWDSASQTWGTRTVGAPFPPDYAVQIGYPYLTLSDGTASTTWPTSWP